jgi:hypothetical protein
MSKDQMQFKWRKKFLLDLDLKITKMRKSHKE